MAKKAKKGISFLGPIIDKNEPKTWQGKANKMMTGDGRCKFENLSFEEKMNCLSGIRVPANKKKTTKK